MDNTYEDTMFEIQCSWNGPEVICDCPMCVANSEGQNLEDTDKPLGNKTSPND